MKYVDNLLEFANDEHKFHKELLNIKTEIEENSNQYNQVKLLVTNVRKYCEKILNEHKDDKVYVFQGNDFCMFILNRMFDVTKEKFKLHEKSVLNLLRVSQLESYQKDMLKESFVDEILTIISVFSPNDTNYRLEKDVDSSIIEALGRLANQPNMDIIDRLIGIKPMIFLAKEGKEEAILTKLGILLRITYIEDINCDTNIFRLIKLYYDIANQIVESTMDILLNDILIDKDLEYLMNKYKIGNDNIKFAIGRDIAEFITKEDSEQSELLKDTLNLADNSRKEDVKLERYILDIAKTIQDNFNI